MSSDPVQRDKALAMANAIRVSRARAKTRVRTLGLRPDEVDPTVEPHLAGMKVVDLLAEVPGVGPTRLPKLCREAGISARTEYRFMAVSQRARLTVVLDRYYATSGHTRRAAA